jgi:hypothetical protein
MTPSLRDDLAADLRSIDHDSTHDHEHQTPQDMGARRVIVVVRLPFEAPPIRSNDRLHWRATARVVKAVRLNAAWAGRQAIRDHVIAGGFPIRTPVYVTLVWEVPDNHVRDAGASQPTLKAALDGLVDAGVLLTDRHTLVREERCRIDVCGSRGVRIEIQVADERKTA